MSGGGGGGGSVGRSGAVSFVRQLQEAHKEIAELKDKLRLLEERTEAAEQRADAATDTARLALAQAQAVKVLAEEAKNTADTVRQRVDDTVTATNENTANTNTIFNRLHTLEKSLKNIETYLVESLEYVPNHGPSVANNESTAETSQSQSQPSSAPTSSPSASPMRIGRIERFYSIAEDPNTNPPPSTCTSTPQNRNENDDLFEVEHFEIKFDDSTDNAVSSTPSPSPTIMRTPLDEVDTPHPQVPSLSPTRFNSQVLNAQVVLGSPPTPTPTPTPTSTHILLKKRNYTATLSPAGPCLIKKSTENGSTSVPSRHSPMPGHSRHLMGQDYIPSARAVLSAAISIPTGDRELKRKKLDSHGILQALDIDSDGGESQGWQNSQSMEIDMDAPCGVCGDVDAEENNCIVFCDRCNIPVCQACYGVQNVPKGKWYCNPCKKGLNTAQLECILCTVRGGALKPVDFPGEPHRIEWGHVWCTWWINEIMMGSGRTQEPIINVHLIPKDRWKLKCSICKIKKGAPIQCSVARCLVAFHATCARNQGLRMDWSDRGGSRAPEFYAYCDNHKDTTPTK